MREIREVLYKVKHQGIWHFGMPLKPIKEKCESCVFQSADNSYYDIFADLNSLCQYTGLTDKNDKMIFEDDVVVIDSEYGEVGVIEWDKDTARFIINMSSVCADFDNYYGREVEVVGSIHDIPTLKELKL